MIGSVTHDVGGASETFRLTTGAMRRVEDHTGEGIVTTLAGMETGFRVAVLSRILAESADSGAGRDMAWADDLIDDIGMGAAADLVGRIAEAAFPEAAAGGKKPRRAASKNTA